MKSNTFKKVLCLLTLLTVSFTIASAALKENNGAMHYFIDPVKGNDNNSGKNRQKPWKSFAPASRLTFSAGDEITILTPGRFDNSLILKANGSIKKPVHVIFAPGRYDFYDTQAYKAKLNISNTNDVPEGQKAIALLITNSKFVTIDAADVRIVLHAKMLEAFIDYSENIHINGLSFDYHTPTVSEFKVKSLQNGYADLEVNKDSHYDLQDSALFFKGDGWRYRISWYWQEYNPDNGYLTRKGLSLDKARFTEIGVNKLRVFFPANPGFKVGFIYQTRDINRDCAGIFMQRSSDILLKNIRIYFMHGMGVVSQFCKNITMDSVVVKPEEASGRTCAAWADILHFSGCRGTIVIKNSYLSGANDDAINIHGVHLRIVGHPASNQLKVRFMHNQTFGFNAYMPGDSIELVHGNSLLPFASHVVLRSEMLNDKEILITLNEPVNDTFEKDDAVENITWTPRVNITHNTITSIPTRGILLTSRRKAVINNNSFLRTSSAAVLVEDDAEGWYESGSVKDLTIENNRFFECGEAVIGIHPENIISKGAVHNNIRIFNNYFIMNGSRALSAKSTKGILFKNNKIDLPAGADISSLTEFKDCTDIHVGENIINSPNKD